MTLQDKIFQKLSKKYNLPVEVIERMYRSQFEFVQKVMESGSKESVRLKYLCIFGVKKSREECIANGKGRRKKKKSSSNESNS